MDTRLLLPIFILGTFALVYFAMEILPLIPGYRYTNSVHAFAVLYCLLFEALQLFLCVAMFIFTMAIIALLVVHVGFFIYDYLMARLPSVDTIQPWLDHFRTSRVLIENTATQGGSLHQSLRQSKFISPTKHFSQRAFQTTPEWPHDISHAPPITMPAKRTSSKLQNQAQHAAQTTPNRPTKTSLAPPLPTIIGRNPSKLKSLRMPKLKPSVTHRKTSTPASSGGIFVVPDEEGFNEHDNHWYFDENDEPILNKHFEPIGAKGRDFGWWETRPGWQTKPGSGLSFGYKQTMY